MSTSSKAKISIETGQTLTVYAAMTDSGDHQIHSVGTIFSGKSGFESSIRPEGMVAGRNVLSVSVTADTVVVAGFTCYLKGVLTTITAASDTFTRNTGPGKAAIISVTVTSGGALAIVPGGEGAGSTFSETRDAAGGPPYIPVNHIEIGQLRITSSTAAVLTAAEIFQVVGTHTERFDFPSWEESNLGDGIKADSNAEQQSHIKLSSALPAIHTGGTYKLIYAQYYTPIFSELAKTSDFVPADQAHSVSSQQYYNGTIASAAASLGAGAFTALLTDGISDAILNEQDEIITVKYWSDRNKSPYVLSQGALGIARSFPVAAQNQAVVTIAAEKKSASFLS